MVKKKLLVVEDNETILEIETTLLKSLGFDVKGVPNGKAALRALTEFKPDLVLLDIVLPDIDGFKVCQYIKNDPSFKHIPVVMVTARNTVEDQKRWEQVGAACYITKPFKTVEVIKIIRQLLDEPK